MHKQVSQSLLYQEIDLLHLGLVVLKARKEGTVLLQRSLIGSYI